MKKLLILAAIGEGATGLVLVVYPQIVTRLLFGADVMGAGIVMSRIAGIALIGLGVACWTGRNVSAINTTAVRAILTYCVLVAIYLAYLGIVSRLAGILLWPAVAVHVGFMVLLMAAWRHDQPRTGAAPPKAA
jgi:hypothetical protein